MVALLQVLTRALCRLLFRVELTGWEHYPHGAERLLIVANHTSFLDGVLLSAFLPEVPVFVINTRMARRWWVRPFIAITRHIGIDPANPHYLKVLIQHLKDGERVAIFPEGRITVTGALMKTYEGPALAADKADAVIVPVHIEGAQYSLLSRLGGKVRRRLYPRIRLTMLPSRHLQAPAELSGRRRRQWLAQQLVELMEELMFAGANIDRTIIQALLEAKTIHGAGRVVLEDVRRRPLNYRQVLTQSFILHRLLATESRGEQHVALLLPTSTLLVCAFFALHLGGRVPVILNFTLGVRGLLAACRTAGVKTLYASRRFVGAVRLEEAMAQLDQELRVVYLEDRIKGLTTAARLQGWLRGLVPALACRRLAGSASGDDPAVVLFTSGTENNPKGVVLTHSNLLANRAQANAVLDLRPGEVFFNALPLFHAFGLTMGALLPLLNGMRLFLYPSPRHYHVIPELIYELGANIIISTNTFLQGYGGHADPYDFFSLRLVIAGAEPLQEETRQLWADKFGIRILEGYGATETSPVLAVNTPRHYRIGSVGRLLPGIEYYLAPAPGISDGGRLCVRGANIMAGYLLYDHPGQLLPPHTPRGAGWYDTGDIATLDGNGFVVLRGRAKRFAKISGEMVPLANVELLAGSVWPKHQHVAVNLPDPVKGERIVLLTTWRGAKAQELVKAVHGLGLGRLCIPGQVISVDKVPVLESGTVDYSGARRLAEAHAAADPDPALAQETG